MRSIKPQNTNSKQQNDFEIKLKDFITIFKSDELSDHIIKMINQEVNNHKQQRNPLPPTFGEQTLIIQQWWKQCKEMYVVEKSLKKKQVAPSRDSSAMRDQARMLNDVSLNTVYEFLIKQRLV